MSDREMPADVDRQSRCRLPLVRREDLDPETQEAFDYITGPNARTKIGLMGPPGIRMHSPRLIAHSQGMNYYLRWDAGFSGAHRELAILVAAREMDSQFERVAHEAYALDEGLAPAIIDLVKTGGATEGLDEAEAVIIDCGRQLFREKRLSSENYARALALFDTRQLVDLITLMSQYAATAMLLAAFDMQLPPGKEPPLA